MKSLILLLTIVITPFQTTAQFNTDSKRIKRKKIKSIIFDNEAKCSFDKQGRLTEYIYGDVGKLITPHGKYLEYSIDSVGNFYRVISYYIFREKIDTTCIWNSTFDSNDLIYSESWEDGVGNQVFNSTQHGDTLFESIQSFEVHLNDTIYKYSELSVTIKISTGKVSRKTCTMNNQKKLGIDSLIKIFQGRKHGSWYYYEFDNNGIIRKEYRLINNNNNNEITRINFDIQSRKYYIPFTNRKRFEQYDEYCLNPSKFVKMKYISLEIEYYTN